MKSTLARTLLAALPLAIATFAAPALAQKAPIKFVVPYPAGGAADQITRLVANETAQILGTTIVIDNKAGAAGMIAGEIVARAEPDGKTFFVGSNAPLVINQALYAKMPYDPEKSFVPVAGMGKSPLLLVTRQNLGVRDVQSLIALGKKDPGKLTMGSASSGNITHLAGEYAANLMGFKVTHVPFAGSAPAITSMMGGNVDIMFDALPSSMQQAKAGRIVPLAILDTVRFPALPDVPTLKETGFGNAEASAWFGVVAPAKTPAAVVNELNKAINEALKKPELVEKLRNIGAQPMPGSPEVFARFIADERARWIPLAQKLGVKAD
ncbi:Bug family tripartite tricarboxylate transporter substrate binding protein [Ramlibacter alkalitolerans]|jgi:tripartite-type tricarboxylate transporter receptor subunit TctC|uniref:Tripartite tricarboxylate transporter substrate binding protein n=1 Tax=Ramlibacter alkalitolerans TaxID=2039631 RepID=A0ABS1JM32_9BURK|nr:tripartite tricarboxylate transporter substrate binding protein [Ramlibacter alkalitolerans]MBL0425292.1 tripartite tricarboxylate transporter substrate binding protein [Ramlibacter alkalitolerans]